MTLNEFPELAERIAAVHRVDTDLEEVARAHLDDLTKPKGSLGRFEDIAARLYMIGGGMTPLSVEPALVVVVSGDHGVVEEGVSAFPQEVTGQMLRNILDGGAGISVLSRLNGMKMIVVDAGGAHDALSEDEYPKLRNLRLARGTANMARTCAMSPEHCAKALLYGMDTVRYAVEQGVRLVATGEMGIGNTTPATALFCALYGLEPEHVAGPGTGLNAAGVRHKAEVIRRALQLHHDVIEARDILGIASALGGYEIMVLAGVVLGAAESHIPVLVDGFISTSAYAVAHAFCPAVAEYSFLAHASAEPGYVLVTECMKQKPLLQLEFRLGEGTGCAAAFPLLRASAAIYNEMATFSGANVTGTVTQPVA